MSLLDQERVDRIKQILKWNPRGMSISDITSKMDMNRNLVSKYLDMLLISGQVEMHLIGAAKVYFLSHRVPVSAMLEFSSDMVIALDSEYRILMVNEPVLALLKEKRDSLAGIRMDDLQNPFISALRIHLPSDVSSMSGHQTDGVSCVLQDKELHFRMKQIPTAFEDGSQGITLIIEDTTAQVAHQKSLMMSEARYRGIVEDQTEFIVRFLPDGTSTFVNDAYARYLEQEKKELVGRPFMPCIHAEDVHVMDHALSSLNRDHPVTTFECRVQFPSGQTHWNAWTVRALYDELGNLSEYQCVGRDNTEKHEAAAKINRYIREMEFLAQTSMAFRDMGEDDDIFEFVAQQVYSLAPGSFLVWVGFFDEPSRTLLLKSVVGNSIALDTVQQLTGMRVVDMTFPIDIAQTAELIRHRKLVRAPPLYQLLHMQVPEETCRKIEEAGWGIDNYLMGLVSRGRIVGDVGLCIQSGSHLPNRDLIEAFIRQAAIAVDRKISDDNLRKSLAREQDQVRNLHFLSKTAMEFVDMADNEDIYRYIGEKILDLTDCAFVAVGSFDIPQRTATIRAVAAKRENMAVLQELGISPLGMTLPLDLTAEDIVLRKRMEDVPPLYYLLFQQLPEQVCTSLEEKLGLGKNYAMGLIHQGEIFGSVVIVLERGKELDHRDTLEAFVNQAAVALLRRYKR